MAEIQRCDNRLGIWGWLGGRRWGVERYAYILHRLTGLGILCCFLMHVVVTSPCARGAPGLD
jgi:succinate dehydrogenase/fumarate reductase cytochrome b subunit